MERNAWELAFIAEKCNPARQKDIAGPILSDNADWRYAKDARHGGNLFCG